MMVFETILEKYKAGEKQIAVLIDPDKTQGGKVKEIISITSKVAVDYIFIGGSILIQGNLQECICDIKAETQIPVLLFPGNTMQIDPGADAILFLSLISGRNAEMLIGKHVIVAPYIKKAQLEVIPTGYMLIESGKPTAVSYMSHSLPIPHDKDDIAVCTAIAGEMLGLKMIYMDAGSGAEHHVSLSMIGMVKKNIAVPLIIGGGINTPEKAKAIFNAGADMIVVGTAVEKDQSLLYKIAEMRLQ